MIAIPEVSVKNGNKNTTTQLKLYAKVMQNATFLIDRLNKNRKKPKHVLLSNEAWLSLLNMNVRTVRGYPVIASSGIEGDNVYLTFQ